MLMLNEASQFNPQLLQAARNLVRQQRQLEQNDPVELARRAGIAPDNWQADVLRSLAQQTILLCSRQAGKSTVTALLALHTALFQAGSLILLLAPALRQSQELFRAMKRIVTGLGSLPVAIAEESALRLELMNESRILCLPGKEATIRGFAGVSLLIVDEAARVPDELYQAVRPMLAVSGGKIVLLSTPFGKRGFFHHEWANGGDDWHRAKITAYDCPRISNEWLIEERQRIGDWWFSQEYLCEFVDSLSQVFSTDDILRAMADESITPLFEERNDHELFSWT